MKRLFLILVLLLVSASMAEVLGQRTDWGYDEVGNYTLITERQLLPGDAFTEADYLPPLPDCGLLWHYNTPIHWIRYAEIGDDAQHLFAGGWTGSEDVLGFSMFKMNGDGEPAWQYWVGQMSYAVCAARDADIFYGGFVSAHPYEDAFRIYKFHALSRTPDWTYDAIAAGYWPSTHFDWYGNVVCSSDDGSVMSIMVSDGDSLAVLFFGPNSPEPFQVFEDEDSPLRPWGGGPRRNTLSPDGSKCIFGNGGIVYFLDVESCTLDGTWDWPGSHWMQKTSPDGTVIVKDTARFSPINVHKWNGEEYELLWSYDLPGVNQAMAGGISRDNQRIVVGWTQDDSNQIVLTGFDIDDPTPVWTYESEIYRDVFDNNYCTDIELSADGEWVVVGTKGISDSGPPETWVFNFSDPEEPAFMIDNRGLVLSVDVTPDGCYMASVSQSVNQGGCWGDCDIYAAYLDPAEDLTPLSFTAEAIDEGVLVRWDVENGRGVTLRRSSGNTAGSGSLNEDFLPLTGAYLDANVIPEQTYRYYLRVYTDDALFREFGPVEVECVPPVDELALFAPYPNPVTMAATISYNLPHDGGVSLIVYDLSGRRVAILLDSDLTAGRHEVSWDASGVPSGVYLVFLDTDSGRAHRRLVVTR